MRLRRIFAGALSLFLSASFFFSAFCLSSKIWENAARARAVRVLSNRGVVLEDALWRVPGIPFPARIEWERETAARARFFGVSEGDFYLTPEGEAYHRGGALLRFFADEGFVFWAQGQSGPAVELSDLKSGAPVAGLPETVTARAYPRDGEYTEIFCTQTLADGAAVKGAYLRLILRGKTLVCAEGNLLFTARADANFQVELYDFCLTACPAGRVETLAFYYRMRAHRVVPCIRFFYGDGRETEILLEG